MPVTNAVIRNNDNERPVEITTIVNSYGFAGSIMSTRESGRMDSGLGSDVGSTIQTALESMVTTVCK